MLFLAAFCGASACIPRGDNSAGRDDSDSDARTQTLSAAGRTWALHIAPANADTSGTPLRPLVLVLHGTGGDGATYLSKNHWIESAATNGFIALAPDAPTMRPDQPPDFFLNPRVWNVGPLVEGTPRAAIDDLAFFDALIDFAVDTMNVDPARIFVAGHSNGASMAFRLAALRSDRIAAIAAVSGLCWETNPAPHRRVPTLFIVGTADPLVPLDGGTQQLPWGSRTTPPVRDSLAAWAAAIGCTSAPALISDIGGVRREAYSACVGGIEFDAIYVEGQGHAWPGGLRLPLPERIIGPSRDIFDATQAATEFFGISPAAASR